MEILIPFYIVNFAVGCFFALNYVLSKKTLEGKDFLMILGFVFLNTLFIVGMYLLTVGKKKEGEIQLRKEQKDKEQAIQYVRDKIGYMGNNWRVRDLLTKNGGDNRNALILYHIIREKGYPDSKALDAALLLEVYDIFLSPPLIYKLRAEYDSTGEGYNE